MLKYNDQRLYFQHTRMEWNGMSIYSLLVLIVVGESSNDGGGGESSVQINHTVEERSGMK